MALYRKYLLVFNEFFELLTEYLLISFCLCLHSFMLFQRRLLILSHILYVNLTIFLKIEKNCDINFLWQWINSKRSIISYFYFFVIFNHTETFIFVISKVNNFCQGPIRHFSLLSHPHAHITFRAHPFNL